MKIIYLTFCVLALFFTTHAMAGLNYYRAGDVKNVKPVVKEGKASNTIIITPIKNCYSKLDKKDVEDIKSNYMKPYGECLKRLKNKPRKTITNTEVKDKKVEEGINQNEIKN